MRWPWRRSNIDLLAPNVGPEWVDRRLWVGWEAPRDVIEASAGSAAALVELAGPPRWAGYCRPVVVCLIREPENEQDARAVRAEVAGRCVGYLRRPVAERLAASLDRAGRASFTVAGLLRGGSPTAREVGCHVWLGRRISPGPDITLAAGEHEVPWPPSHEELFGTAPPAMSRRHLPPPP